MTSSVATIGYAPSGARHLRWSSALIAYIALIALAHAAPPASYFLGLGIYRPASNHVYLYADLGTKLFDMNGVFGVAGDIPVVGDFDGNGVSDLAVYRAGSWLINLHHNFSVDTTIAFGGNPIDIPLTADFDGDGIADLVIYRSGTWYFRSSKTGLISQRSFGGLPDDKPVIGDFDGDGIPDISVFRNGTWLIQASSANQTIIDHFGGRPGDVPCVADWNHDGHADLCIYRNGVWRFKAVGLGGLLDTYTFGGAGDVPLAGGAFDYSSSIYVNAAAVSLQNGTPEHPFASVSQAFAAGTTTSGAVIRVAAGSYTDNFVLTGPTHPNGKNNLRILGVDRRAVTWSPASGDVITLYGSVGNLIEGFKLSSPAANGRGVVLIGGAGSVAPGDPGATLILRFNTISNTGAYGILVTGSSNATIQYNTIAQSQTKSGIGTQSGTPAASIIGNDIYGNGYMLASGIDGNGIEAQSSSQLTINNNKIHDNNRFGIVGINNSTLYINDNTISANQLNGVILCGASPNDTSTAHIVGNTISGNGINTSNGGFNGIEFFQTCTGTQTVSGNIIDSNSYNGIFIGSGSILLTNNTLSNNKDGITVYVDNNSSADTSANIFGNQFSNNMLDGVFVDLPAGTAKTIQSTIGGTQIGQSNNFTGQGLHGIGCLSSQPVPTVVCPTGGNTFSLNADNIESACPSTCVQ